MALAGACLLAIAAALAAPLFADRSAMQAPSSAPSPTQQGGGELRASGLCMFPNGFSCGPYSFDYAGNLNLDLRQATGAGITVTGIACSDSLSAPHVRPMANAVEIGSGGHAQVAGGGSGNEVQCCPSGWTECEARVAIEYSWDGGYTGRVIYGDVHASR
jgi:hypothetical protein